MTNLLEEELAQVIHQGRNLYPLQAKNMDEHLAQHILNSEWWQRQSLRSRAEQHVISHPSSPNV